MSKWLKTTGALAIAAVVLGVLAVGTTRGGVAADCVSGAGATDIRGKVTTSDTQQVTFCSDPTVNLAVFLRWDSGKRDLALAVTEPNGTQHIVDTHGQNNEAYYQAAALPEGTWTIKVTNNGKSPVNYTLSVFFFR